MFFDLSFPYCETPKTGGKTSRLKLATKAMELGYVGIAHNRSIKNGMSDKDYCAIPLLDLGSLVKVAKHLASSVGFHRDLLNVPRATPFRQYTRITVGVESEAQCLGLNLGNPILKSYDIVSVRPLNENAFNLVCTQAEVDLISIDFSEELPFLLKHSMVKAAIKRGIYFEIKYSDFLSDAQKGMRVISNAKLLVDWTKGKNLIISSGASSVTQLRGPNDVINLMSLLGLSAERARAAISTNCRNMIIKVLRKKRFYKEAVKVEVVSNSEKLDPGQPLSGDWLKWDPLSTGEGDISLDDLTKAFNATNDVSALKSSNAIDFTSVLDGLQSHCFQVKDILKAEPLPQPTVNMDQVPGLSMAVSSSSDDTLQESKSMSNIIDIRISEDDSKVEPRRIVLEEESFALRKCSISSQEQRLLVQDLDDEKRIAASGDDEMKIDESSSETSKSHSPEAVEGEIHTGTNHQSHAMKSGKLRGKRSRVNPQQLRPLKHFQTKRISKRSSKH